MVLRREKIGRDPSERRNSVVIILQGVYKLPPSLPV